MLSKMMQVVIIVGAFLCITGYASAEDSRYVSTFEDCSDIANKKRNGDCRITGLEASQAQTILQLFANNDPKTTSKYSKYTSIERAGDVWPSMEGLRDKASPSPGNGTLVMVCVGYGPKGSTVFRNCNSL